MNKIWGYAYNGQFVETGATSKGAKSSATKNGSTEVGYRSFINNMYIPVYRKSGTWYSI